MKISELIKELEALKAEHGDLECRGFDEYEMSGSPCPLVIAHVRSRDKFEENVPEKWVEITSD